MDGILKSLNFLPMDFILTLINILIVVFVLNKFLFKAVGKNMDNRIIEVERDRNSIRDSWEEVRKKESSYDEIIRGAKVKTSEIIEKASIDGEKLKQDLVSEGKNRADELLNKAQIDIEKEKDRAMESIKDDVADLVYMNTLKVLGKSVDDKLNKELVQNINLEVGDKDE